MKELLVQWKEKSVVDHSIYSKILEVIIEERHSDLKDFINLRMGGFHAAGVLFGVIGKQFGDADLIDVMVEVGVLGEDATQNNNEKLYCNKTNKNYTGMFINR